jgi:hypothetical protein
LKGLRDEDIDRLLSGKAPGLGAADDLAAFVQGVQAVYVAPPAEDAALRQIAAAAAVARRAAPSGAPVAEPSIPAPASLFSRWRRRTVFGVSVATMTLSIGAAAIAATAATGGLAAKGDLPGPIQRAVSQAASDVGITLPSGNAGSGTSGSGSSRGGPPAGSAGSKANASPSATPGASATPGRGRHDGSPLPGAVRPGATPQTDDRHGGRGSDDGSAGIPGGAAATSASHSNCVAYAEQIAGSLGLDDSRGSAFVSLVDHDQTAVTVRVAEQAKPDAACQSSIDKARAWASAGTGDGRRADDHSVPPSAPPPAPGSGHGKDASPAPPRTPTPAPAPAVTPTSDHSLGTGASQSGRRARAEDSVKKGLQHTF